MSLPYFNLYPRDFEADTSHLTLEEDGAYNRLLRLCWMTPGCSLPDDDAWIMRRMRVDEATFVRVVKPIIEEFFLRKSGRVTNARLSREFGKVDETSRKRSTAGKKGGRPKAVENKHKEEKPGFDFDKGGLSDTRALPEPEPEPDKYSEANASGDFAADPAKAVFDAGVKVLGQCGTPERQARAFLGKLRRDHPDQDGQILTAIMDCGRAGAVDPIPWITASLSARPRIRAQLPPEFSQ